MFVLNKISIKYVTHNSWLTNDTCRKNYLLVLVLITGIERVKGPFFDYKFDPLRL